MSGALWLVCHAQRDRGIPLGELLIKMGLVSRDDLQTALARKMGYPLVNLEKFQAEVDALLKVPFQVATRLSVVPLLLRDTTLIVAVEDPSKRMTLAELEFITQCKIVPVLAQHSQIEWAASHSRSRTYKWSSRAERRQSTRLEGSPSLKRRYCQKFSPAPARRLPCSP